MANQPAANQVIIFVKAPVPGKVKTRLCPPLSKIQAAALYAAFVKDTWRLVRKVPSARAVIFYRAMKGYPDLRWMGSGYPTLFSPQEGVDLGARLRRAFERSFAGGAGKVVAIGSDTPHLEPSAIAKAFALLSRHDVVLGPALDGGYYLIGLNRPDDRIFADIAWSTPKVYKQTIQRAKKHGLKVGILDEMFDIDAMSDLKALASISPRAAKGRLQCTLSAMRSLQAK